MLGGLLLAGRDVICMLYQPECYRRCCRVDASDNPLHSPASCFTGTVAKLQTCQVQANVGVGCNRLRCVYSTLIRCMSVIGNPSEQLVMGVKLPVVGGKNLCLLNERFATSIAYRTCTVVDRSPRIFSA